MNTLAPQKTESESRDFLSEVFNKGGQHVSPPVAYVFAMEELTDVIEPEREWEMPMNIAEFEAWCDEHEELAASLIRDFIALLDDDEIYDAVVRGVTRESQFVEYLRKNWTPKGVRL